MRTRLSQSKDQQRKARWAKMHGRKQTKFMTKVDALESKGLSHDSARAIAGSMLVKERKRFGTRIVFRNGRKISEPAI